MLAGVDVVGKFVYKRYFHSVCALRPLDAQKIEYVAHSDVERVYLRENIPIFVFKLGDRTISYVVFKLSVEFDKRTASLLIDVIQTAEVQLLSVRERIDGKAKRAVTVEILKPVVKLGRTFFE